uniref:Uncharacterized protein n=1 Tax=Oryza sativa subsp. japonica TaxID=39947 RepID=Q5Z672_ORYSJ|nr:hypothetical protein [Oryza sativa Japonica Group]
MAGKGRKGTAALLRLKVVEAAAGMEGSWRCRLGAEGVLSPFPAYLEAGAVNGDMTMGGRCGERVVAREVGAGNGKEAGPADMYELTRGRVASVSHRAALLLLLVLLLCLTSSSLAESEGRRWQPRRLLVSPAATSSQHRAGQQQQQMRVDGANKPFKQPATAASFGRRRVPRSGWNPIQNR